MKLIVWLWNPGDKYVHNRHNVWFLFLDWIKNELNLWNFKNEKKYLSEIIEWEIDWKKVILLKPQTFMNLSWQAVISVINYFNITIEDLMIIYDDKDLDFWIVRFKENWSSWWHNWIKNIIKILWTENFSRIKIWVANETLTSKDTSEFVLSNFSKDEMDKLWKIFTESDKKLIEWIKK